jgi:hypothetical protein
LLITTDLEKYDGAEDNVTCSTTFSMLFPDSLSSAEEAKEAFFEVSIVNL